VAIVLLIIGLVFDVVALIIEIDNYGVLSDLDRGIDVPIADVSAADDRSTFAALAQLGLYVPVIVAFLVWFSRAYRNLERLSVSGLRYGQGWSIGAWFVPILAFFRPKQIANDIWRASAAPRGSDWHTREVPSLIHWWWGIWIATGLLGNISGRAYVNAQTLKEQLSASSLSAVSDVVSIVAAVMAILVIRAVTARQESCARQPVAPQPEAQSPSAPMPPLPPLPPLPV
jgi:hypothetical protein